MSDLLPIQRARSWHKAVLAGSVGAYCVLLAITIPRHQPWADEAQGWQIARSNSFLEIFRTAIHYEISPGLWHALLWLLIRLHLTYAGLPWFSAFVAVCGVCVLVFRSPLPLVLRAFLPFTYFFAFQYSVIARNYVLFAPLLFLLATLWPQRRQRPLLMAVVLGLLANVCAHGFVIALGLLVVLVVEYYRDAHSPEFVSHETRVDFLALTLVAAFLGFALWCMIPPRNANWANGAVVALHRPGLALLYWFSNARHPMLNVPLPIRIPIQILLRLSQVLSEGFSPFKTLACIAWAILIWRWWREQRLRYAVPVVLVAVFCVFSRFEVYHAGLVWILFIFLWWVTWPTSGRDPSQIALIALVSLFILTQTIWTTSVIQIEEGQAYSPDRAAAPILRHYLAEGMQVDIAVAQPPSSDAGEYYAVGLEPYFDEEPFHNAPARYWTWKRHPKMYAQYLRDTDQHSAVALLETVNGKFALPEDRQRLLSLGYRQDAVTCGRTIYPMQYTDEQCHVFYIPNQAKK